jgi:hypothetical protein
MSIVSASASPSATATAVTDTPATANDAQPACPKKRPSRLLRNALASISKYCEPCVPQAFPHVDLSAQPDCETGIFIDSALTESGEANLTGRPNTGLTLSSRRTAQKRAALSA